MEAVSEQLNCGLLLKIDLTKYLEIANIGYGIGPNVLRRKFEKVKDLSEEF